MARKFAEIGASCKDLARSGMRRAFLPPMSEIRPSTLESGICADAAIPEVWADLVSGRIAGLRELIAGAVAARAGFAPDPGRVAEFLERLARPDHLETERTSETHPGIRGPSIFPRGKEVAGEDAD